MIQFLKILIIISLVVNYLLVIRFKNNKYFIFLFVAALITPLHIIITYLLKLNSYTVIPFISVLLLLAYPQNEIKRIILSFFSLLILFPHFGESKLIPLLISSFNSVYIIYLLCDDLFEEIKNRSQIPLFIPLLIVEFIRGTFGFYLFYENQPLLVKYYYVFMISEIIFISMITYLGPSLNLKIKLKKQIDKKLPSLNFISSENKTKTSDYGLTEREIDVLSLLADGLTSQEIAEKLFLSKKTVDYYRGNIRLKLNIQKKSELITFYNTNIENTLPYDGSQC